jgi:glycerate kinase
MGAMPANVTAGKGNLQMRIIIAAGALKHSLSAVEAAQAIARGLHHSGIGADLVLLPIADGGNGTLEAFLLSGGQEIVIPVSDPLGRPIKASFGLLGSTAVIEMALASGLEHLKPDELSPLTATTYGTGQLMKAALDAGAERVIVGVGGSATVDGGAGCMQALGVRFLDTDGKEIPPGGGSLHLIEKIDMHGLDPRWKNVEVIIASDVINPTLGEQGAAAIFGPQKGASPADVETLENNLRDFFMLVAGELGVDVRDTPGGGAAGALSAGLMAFLGGKIQSGIDLILDVRSFDQMLEDAALVITSEGRMDTQTIHGKGPVGVAKRAQARGVRTVALVGGLAAPDHVLHEAEVWAALPIIDTPMTIDTALAQAERLIERAAERLGYLLQLNLPLDGAATDDAAVHDLHDDNISAGITDSDANSANTPTGSEKPMDSRVEGLIKTLHEGDASARQRTLHTLTEIGAEAVAPLIALLHESDDPALRRGAAYALMHLSDPLITPALIDALEKDSDSEVRIYAARSLAAQTDSRAIEPLIVALQDEDPAVREEVVRALGELAEALNSPRAIEPLAETLKDTDWGTRQSAAEMLIRLKQEHVDDAERLLLTDLVSLTDEIKLGAAWSLIEVGDERALDPLVELLNHPDARISSNAARGLGELGDQRAVIALTAALSHANDTLRKAAQDALDRLNSL